IGIWWPFQRSEIWCRPFVSSLVEPKATKKSCHARSVYCHGAEAKLLPSAYRFGFSPPICTPDRLAIGLVLTKALPRSQAVYSRALPAYEPCRDQNCGLEKTSEVSGQAGCGLGR